MTVTKFICDYDLLLIMSKINKLTGSQEKTITLRMSKLYKLVYTMCHQYNRCNVCPIKGVVWFCFDISEDIASLLNSFDCLFYEAWKGNDNGDGV